MYCLNEASRNYFGLRDPEMIQKWETKAHVNHYENEIVDFAANIFFFNRVICFCTNDVQYTTYSESYKITFWKVALE